MSAVDVFQQIENSMSFNLGAGDHFEGKPE